MFNLFKKHPEPPDPSPDNPGLGPIANVGFSNNERSWEENVDLVDVLARVLRELGHECDVCKGWVQMDKLQLQPQLVSLTPLDDGGVQTLSTIEVSHPDLGETGMFEYQHSTGDDLDDSFSKGFRGWADTDLPVFLDLEREDPEICTILSIDLPATEESPALSRRVLLAPPIRYARVTEDLDEDHPFCPCCLVTNNYAAFERFIIEDGAHGIRLFALRDEVGDAEADCRVDGVDYADGEAALRDYAGTWVKRGYEYRKQYVLVHSPPQA